MTGALLEKGNAILAEKKIGARVGAETGRVVGMTREYFDSLAIETRAIDAVEASTKCNFFGCSFATPIMPAALSGLGGIHPDGLAEVAKGAKQAGAAMWAGIGDEAELRGVAAAQPDTLKIIKPYRDHGLIQEKIRQAESLGLPAVGMDINFGFGGKVKESLIRADIMSPKSTKDIEGFVRSTSLPFVLKGVLSVADAQKALAAGAGGIVVSNHGGSIIDYAVPPLMILPDIVKAVDGKIPVFLDGGILRGSDVFKALALGADGVLVGRTVMAGLAADGAEGVAAMLTGLTEELRRILSLTGATGVKDIDPSVLHPMARTR